ncbi:MAG: hypothetical protein GYB37_00630 [Algicola sp.]|nr:hypothetical protein [Algicola sp.]
MDGFENYVRKHRSLFDDHRLDTERVWLDIERKISDEEVGRVPFWRNSSYKIAASFLILLGIGALIGGILINGFKEEELFVASPINQELAEINIHYTATIDHYRKRIEQYPDLTQADKEDFLEFLSKLDVEYDVLEAELHKNINNERVLQALVENQKIRIELINNFLNQIKRSNKEKENYESYSL